jgi:hypothetical protein
MVHKIKEYKTWLIRTDAIVSGTDYAEIKKVGDEIFQAVTEVDKRHPTTKKFTFRNVHTAHKEIIG